ncbi:glycoside hydrolase family 31 protein [Spirochaetia bacterium 38H-sp]|uniref:Glycoside hydrolase family 31 protein n=1 Tax=Rarispira pelagica TaxID=3141764 RepID=A0ABU9UDV3_9SPIR
MNNYKAGKIKSYKQENNTVIAIYEGLILTVEAIDKAVFRVRAGRELPLKEYRSLSVIYDSKALTASAEKTDNGLVVSYEDYSIVLRDNAAIDFYHGKKVLSHGDCINITGDTLYDYRTLGKKEEILGLGEQVSPLSRRGYIIENWNNDAAFPHTEATRPMYCSIPFFMSVNISDNIFWGYFLDSPYKSIFDIGNTDWDKLIVSLYRDDLTVYFIGGDTPDEIIERYTALTGRYSMPPLWALGYHQCKYSYMSETEAKEVATRLREEKIPCDGFWYDIDYMDAYRVFTFDKNRYPNPKKHLKEMKELGFHPVFIVDPGIKSDSPGVYDVCDQGKANDFFMKYPDGRLFEGRVWPGQVHFPDFSRRDVRDWWADLHEVYFSAGAEGIWNDMNEPALLRETIKEDNTIPEEVRMYDDGRWSGQDRMHNLYAMYEAMATRAAFDKMLPDRRPFLLTRSGFAGIQRYAAVWTGDNRSTWEHLAMSVPQLINMSLSGVGFIGADVGGFGENTNPELMVRWYQLGSFYPFFRGHNENESKPQEPYLFGDDITALIRKAVSFRYRMLPYLYSQFYLMTQKGTPVFRPIFWEDRAEYAFIRDQFLWGDSIMVAPCLEKGQKKRLVYVPEGIWYDRNSFVKYNGRQHVITDTPLDTVPIYVKEGAVIPVYPYDIQHTGQIDRETLYLEVWPIAEGENSGIFIEDDGISREQETLIHRYTRKNNQLIVSIDRKTSYKRLVILLPNMDNTWETHEYAVNCSEDMVIKIG